MVLPGKFRPFTTTNGFLGVGLGRIILAPVQYPRRGCSDLLHLSPENLEIVLWMISSGIRWPWNCHPFHWRCHVVRIHLLFFTGILRQAFLGWIGTRRYAECSLIELEYSCLPKSSHINQYHLAFWQRKRITDGSYAPSNNLSGVSCPYSSTEWVRIVTFTIAIKDVDSLLELFRIRISQFKSRRRMLLWFNRGKRVTRRNCPPVASELMLTLRAERRSSWDLFAFCISWLRVVRSGNDSASGSGMVCTNLLVFAKFINATSNGGLTNGLSCIKKKKPAKSSCVVGRAFLRGKNESGRARE